MLNIHTLKTHTHHQKALMWTWTNLTILYGFFWTLWNSLAEPLCVKYVAMSHELDSNTLLTRDVLKTNLYLRDSHTLDPANKIQPVSAWTRTKDGITVHTSHPWHFAHAPLDMLVWTENTPTKTKKASGYNEYHTSHVGLGYLLLSRICLRSKLYISTVYLERTGCLQTTHCCCSAAATNLNLE